MPKKNSLKEIQAQMVKENMIKEMQELGTIQKVVNEFVDYDIIPLIELMKEALNVTEEEILPIMFPHIDFSGEQK